MKKTDLENYRKAGQIAVQVKKYARTIIKKNTPLLEIAEKIEDKIQELGGKPAFPTNLSINEIAAHYTPAHDDETKAHGLLKIDFGVHIKGFSADTAFSVDLENNGTNKKLIQTAEDCLKSAIEAIKQEKNLGKIGQAIQDTAEQAELSPIKNLTGHEIKQYDLHAGINIPNFNNNSPTTLDDGIYAIEPFTTTGQGMVYEGKPSGIYQLVKSTSLRDQKSREVLNHIIEEYQTLPFCSRWLVKKFGTRALLSLKLIEQAGALHQFPQLIEKSKSPVAQAEHTIIIEEGKVEITTD